MVPPPPAAEGWAFRGLTGPTARPVCKYGRNCIRKNPQHFADFEHPGRCPTLDRDRSPNVSSRFSAGRGAGRRQVRFDGGPSVHSRHEATRFDVCSWDGPPRRGAEKADGAPTIGLGGPPRRGAEKADGAPTIGFGGPPRRGAETDDGSPTIGFGGLGPSDDAYECDKIVDLEMSAFVAIDQALELRKRAKASAMAGAMDKTQELLLDSVTQMSSARKQLRSGHRLQGLIAAVLSAWSRANEGILGEDAGAGRLEREVSELLERIVTELDAALHDAVERGFPGGGGGMETARSGSDSDGAFEVARCVLGNC